MLQWFTHRVNFQESPPYSKEGFFGSESKGRYKYDKDVSGGSILFTFYKADGQKDFFKTYFNIQNMAEQEGIFNSTLGQQFRKWILSPGYTYDPDYLIRQFLQREPSQDAFLRQIGVLK